MKWTAWCVAAALVVVPMVSEARGGGKRGSSGPRYDPSLDFSKHFDEEVKYDREHPKDEDADAAPPPKKRKSSHKKKHAPPPQPEPSSESAAQP